MRQLEAAAEHSPCTREFPTFNQAVRLKRCKSRVLWTP